MASTLPIPKPSITHKGLGRNQTQVWRPVHCCKHWAVAWFSQATQKATDHSFEFWLRNGNQQSHKLTKPSSVQHRLSKFNSSTVVEPHLEPTLAFPVACSTMYTLSIYSHESSTVMLTRTGHARTRTKPTGTRTRTWLTRTRTRTRLARTRT